MKVLINGKTWQEIKEANDFTELILYLKKRVHNKEANMYWQYSSGVLIEGVLQNNKEISLFIETEEQYKNRLEREKFEEIIKKEMDKNGSLD